MGLVAAVIAVSLSGCGSNDSASSAAKTEKKKILVFSYFPPAFNEAAQTWASGWDAAAKELLNEFDVKVKAPGKLEADPAAYMSFINTALVEQPDGIVVVANDATAMQAGLKRIAASGVDVLIQDQNPPNFPEKVSLVGIDNKKAGAQAADWIIDKVKAGVLPSKKVAILASPPGVTSVDERVAGFEEAVKAAGLEVVAKTDDGCLEAAKARGTMSDILTAHPDLGSVFSVCDLITVGAARAIKAADRLDIGLVSLAASDDAVKRMLKGEGSDVEIVVNGYDMSRVSVLTLAKALKGARVPDFIDSGVTLVTPDNGKEFLAEAERLRNQ